MKNTNLRAAVALLCAVTCTCALAACSGSGAPGSAQALLNETFSGHTQIESGDVSLSFDISASGSGSQTKPLAVRLTGPFDGSRFGKLPRFALELQLAAGGHTLGAGATSTGSALYVQLAGTWFSTPSSTYSALEEGYAQATKRASTAKVRSTFSSLGIEPGKWLSDPAKAGTATIAGDPTVHLTAKIDIPAFLADVSRLSQAGGTLGLGSPVPGAPTPGGTLSPALISELAKSIQQAHVDVYTGQSDHLLRRLEVNATVAGTPQTRALLGGLSKADVKLLLEFSSLNKPQTIVAPSNPEPPSQLLPALQQLVGLVQGAGGGTSGLESSPES